MLRGAAGNAAPPATKGTVAVHVTWTHPADHGAPIRHYCVERAIAAPPGEDGGGGAPSLKHLRWRALFEVGAVGVKGIRPWGQG